MVISHVYNDLRCLGHTYQFSSLSLNTLNCSPCKGLVNTSAIISLVFIYFTHISPWIILSCRKKYLMSTCLVFSLLLLPFLISCIADILSWYKMAGGISYDNADRKLRVHMTWLPESLIPTSSASVELFAPTFSEYWAST